MPEATLVAAIDAFANEAKANQNYGASPFLGAREGAGASHRAYIYFPRPFPLDVTIVEAELRLGLYTAYAGINDFELRRIIAAWKEGSKTGQVVTGAGLTWNNRPTVTEQNLVQDTITDGAAGDEAIFDVLPILSDVAAAGAWFGFEIRQVTQSGSRRLHSAESPETDLRPTLYVRWTEGAAPPDNHRPGGGRAVSLAAGIHTFSYRHASESLAAIQVQVDDDIETPDWVTPEFDSGEVATTEEQFDLAALGYAGVPEGAERVKRMRVKDASGEWSDWSPEVTWRRVSKGTLAITNPPTDGSVVEETTPPVTHVYTPFATEVQEAAEQVLRENPGAGFIERVRAPRRATTDTVWTVPAGHIRLPGDVDNYETRVRVWDDTDREEMPGDPAYVEAIRTFGFDSSGPAAVDSIEAVAENALIHITVESALQPDYFALVVDGEVVFDRLDPTELAQGGGVYALTWYGAQPDVAHTIEMQRVVDDAGVLKHSAANPTEVVTTSPKGVWILVPATGAEVVIAGHGPYGSRIGETFSRYELVGRRDRPKIRTRVGGYEGSIEGFLADMFGVTAHQYRDTLRDAAAGTDEVRLVLDDLNIPVSIDMPAVPPDPEVLGRLEVSLEFSQSGEFFDLPAEAS